jgi:hypothetical protein
MIRSKLRYIGSGTRFAFKRDWVSGSEVSMDIIFNLLKSKCHTTDNFDSNFIKWFEENYLNNSSDFEMRLIQSDLQIDEEDEEGEGVEDLNAIEWDDSDGDNLVKVESSTIKVSKSLASAKKDLVKSRKKNLTAATNTVNSAEKSTVNVTQVEQKTNVTGQDMIKNQPKLGENVITGDDLQNNYNMSSKLNQRPAGLVLDEQGNVKNALPTNKEKQQRIDAEMANLSGRAKILLVDDNSKEDSISRVVTGDNLQNASTTNKELKKSKSKRGRKPKVNSNFQTTQSASVSVEILPDHIVRAESDKEAIRLIKSCKSSTTLKVAKIYLKDRGKHRLVEYIDQQISKLPPGQ